MKINLGCTTGTGNTEFTQKERIQILHRKDIRAIELGLVHTTCLDEVLDDETISLLRSFEYRSIHAPVVFSVDVETGEKDWITYPGDRGEEIIEKLLNIAKQIGAHTILFHPDQIQDFDWINKKIGSLLAFENMDSNKSFGSTVEDMKKAFELSPQARWVCDVNHIFTVDPTMKLAKDFHDAFSGRLAHYHLSGYGGFHDCLYITGEDIIMDGVQDFSKPVIHEEGFRHGMTSLEKEFEYVHSYYLKKT